MIGPLEVAEFPGTECGLFCCAVTIHQPGVVLNNIHYFKKFCCSAPAVTEKYDPTGGNDRQLSAPAECLKQPENISNSRGSQQKVCDKSKSVVGLFRKNKAAGKWSFFYLLWSGLHAQKGGKKSHRNERKNTEKLMTDKEIKGHKIQKIKNK